MPSTWPMGSRDGTATRKINGSSRRWGAVSSGEESCCCANTSQKSKKQLRRTCEVSFRSCGQSHSKQHQIGPGQMRVDIEMGGALGAMCRRCKSETLLGLVLGYTCTTDCLHGTYFQPQASTMRQQLKNCNQTDD